MIKLISGIFGLFFTCFFSFVVCQEDWKWVTPYPTGNTITVIKGTDKNNILLGDKNGGLYRTNDGGKAWLKLNTNSFSAIQDICLLGSNSIYVLSGDMYTQQIIFSHDGGKTFMAHDISKSIPTYITADKIRFIDGSRGYISYTQSKFERSYVLTTADSGKTWVNFFKADTIANDFHIFNINEAVIVGQKGMVARTSDGGKTWKQDATIENINCMALEAINDKSLYLLGSDSSIYKSDDRAKTWNRINFNSSSPLTDICFSDSLNGFAIGIKGKLHSTDDGGASWVEKNIFTGTFEYKEGVVITGGKYGYMSISADNGETWNRNNGATFLDYTSVAVQKNSIWIIKQNQFRYDTAFVQCSVDGGKTWDTKIKKYEEFAGVSLVDSLNYYALGKDGTFYKSVNSGTDWETSHLPVKNRFGYKGLFFLTPLVGWVYTKFNSVFLTIDGGKTWSEKKIGNAKPINDLTFMNDKNGICVGDSGMVALTSDGGLTWTISTNLPNGNITSVDYVNEKIWVTSENSQLFNSKDYGVTWDTATVSGSKWFYIFNSLAFIDSLNGIAVGGDVRWGNIGHAAITNDGGKNWTMKTYLSSSEFNKIIYTPHHKAYICGDNGMLKSFLNPNYESGLFHPKNFNAAFDISCEYSNGILSLETSLPTFTFLTVQLFTIKGGNLGIFANNNQAGSGSFKKRIDSLEEGIYLYKAIASIGLNIVQETGSFLVK